MPDQFITVEIPGVGEVDFPSSMSEDERNAAAKRLYEEAQAASQSKLEPSSVRQQSEDDPLGYLKETVSNIPASFGRAVSDTVTGLFGLGRQAVMAPVQLARGENVELDDTAWNFVPGVVQSFKDRYGSPEARARTVRDDPMGMVADASTLLGGAGLAAKGAGLAGRVASRVPVAAIATPAGKVAKVAAAVAKRADDAERLTNPLTLPGKAVAKVADRLSDIPIVASVRPSTAIRADLATKGERGSRRLARTIKEERITTPEQANRRRFQLQDDLKNTLKVEDASNPFIDTEIIAGKLHGKPMEVAKRRAQLGVDPNAPARVQTEIDRYAPRYRDDGFGGVEELEPVVGRISLPEAQALKREMQDVAYEPGSSTAQVNRLMNEAIAQGYREAIEEVLPEVHPLNSRIQALGGVEKALETASDRPTGLTNLLSTGAAVGTALGTGSWEGLLTGVAMKALDSPELGIRLGRGINDAGRVAANPTLQRGALVGRMNEAELTRALLLKALEEEEQTPR